MATRTFMKLAVSATLSLGLLAGGALMLNHSGDNVAYAQSSKAVVDGAIARGEVGEQIDGYLGIVDGANPSELVRASVRDINIQRRDLYKSAADRGNVETSVYAALAGEKQLKKAPRGAFVKDASGVWKKK